MPRIKANFTEILTALTHEITATLKKAGRQAVKALGATLIAATAQGRAIYRTKVQTASHLEELDDQTIRLAFKGLDPPWISATPLSIDRRRGQLLFEARSTLPETHLGKAFDALTCEDDLVRAVSEALERHQDDEDALAWKLITDGFEPTTIKAAPFKRKTKLDQYQVSAIDHALTHDITLLIGPPATGKTTTLAELITEYVLRGYRVLVVASANVAVDNIVIKTVATLERLGKDGHELLDTGRVLRFGHPRLPGVAKDRRLFPHVEAVEDLRAEQDQLVDKLVSLKSSRPLERATLQRRLNSIRSRIKEAQREALTTARVVFTTVSQTALSETLMDIGFDVVLQDEVSVMRVPDSLCSAFCATKHLVLAGDRKQLPPVVLATTKLAKDWLHRSVFDLHPADHPSVVLLRNQRRMHKDICELVNDAYYDGKLITKTPQSSLQGTALSPLPGRATVLVEFFPEHGNVAERTPNQSRLNKGSYDVVARILRSMNPLPQGITVRVITAYRAQADLIYGRVAQDPVLGNWLKDERLGVGTVHTFQGNEADVIIFDVLDNRDSGLGKPFKGESGHRLANVAITRAKGKLIVVADPMVFCDLKSMTVAYGISKIMREVLVNSENIISSTTLPVMP